MSEVEWADEKIVDTVGLTSISMREYRKVWDYILVKFPVNSFELDRTKRYRSILVYWALLKTRRGPRP